MSVLRNILKHAEITRDEYVLPDYLQTLVIMYWILILFFSFLSNICLQRVTRNFCAHTFRLVSKCFTTIRRKYGHKSFQVLLVYFSPLCVCVSTAFLARPHPLFSSRNLVLHNLVFTAFEFPANSFPTTESDYVRKFYFHNYSNKSA